MGGSSNTEPTKDEWERQSCGSLSGHVTVSKPNLSVIGELKNRDPVTIELDEDDLVIVRNQDGTKIGYITMGAGARLKHCLNEDYSYSGYISNLRDNTIFIYFWGE